ncbi:hypothetical protein JMM81_01780 [Bacillus sp. V3B]|uniref:YqgU-like beta propeller domain-containing protein n=1 Tax=Bacillus sp. V3B TaxID=2804915 RepID=UPI00210D3973|nr:hypothetical protein [Bacillus sp. V3B]MCQ6273706.1 hypothetical protein [Bacillus sp. V3B]
MKSKAFFLWLLLIPTLLMIGCEKKGASSSQTQLNQNQATESVDSFISLVDVKENVPIPMEEGDFEKVHGWLSEQAVVYSTNMQNGSNVYVYNLIEGTSKLLAEMDTMIDSIHISDAGNYLLIRSSTTTLNCFITIVNEEGKIVFSENIDAFDVAVEWNPYNEEKVLISTFTEDWQDRTFEISINDQTMSEIELSNPFAYWIDENDLIFIDRNQEESSLWANLVMKDLISGKEKELFPDIFQVGTFNRMFITITSGQDDRNDAVYRFYESNLNPAGHFSMPKLSLFSDWLVPYYDFIERSNMFISFQPLHNDEIGMYNKGFQLFTYELGSKDTNKQLIMEGLENEPISCSSDGNLCLYGYYFEKLIDLENKKITQLVS